MSEGTSSLKITVNFIYTHYHIQNEDTDENEYKNNVTSYYKFMTQQYCQTFIFIFILKIYYFHHFITMWKEIRNVKKTEFK